MSERKPEILIIEDEQIPREYLAEQLSAHYAAYQASNRAEALQALTEHDIGLVLLDLMLGSEDGLELLPRIKEFDDEVEVVILTGLRDVKTIVKAMRLGAFDYVLKDSLQEIETVLERARERQRDRRKILYLNSELQEQVKSEFITSRNAEMKSLNKLLKQAAPQNVTILIQGESGTGKELVARMIHRMSPRDSKPFVTVNMSAIPANLVESLLFGHEKGAFTGADRLQRGKFELAHEGTLFLDEVADLPLESQPKLLRVLQENEIERLGGSHTIPVDVRLIAATNRNLEDMVAKGNFRDDLYYRLHVVPLKLPPLRDRREDIPLLIRHFLAIFNRKFGKRLTGVSKDVLNLLEHYPWPGNIRELEHLCECIAVTAKGPTINIKDLPSGFGSLFPTSGKESSPAIAITMLNEAIREFERQYLEAALKDQGWHQGKTAKLLRIHRKTLETKLKKYGLVKPGR